MCLKNITTKEPLIAKKDITVYKIVNENYFIIPELKDLLKTGDKCKAIVDEIEINGKIFKMGRGIFICHNNSNLKTNIFKTHKLNYKYSFIIGAMGTCVTSLIVNKQEFINIFYHTPYIKTIIELGKKYTSELYLYEFLNLVEKGLHSFVQKPNIKEGQYLVKCIIPKGSKYYKGIFEIDSYSFDSIASDKLKYIKIIKK